jgi:hypothetical protein
MLILNVSTSFKNTIHGGSNLFLFFYSKKLGYTQQEVFIPTKKLCAAFYFSFYKSLSILVLVFVKINLSQNR